METDRFHGWSRTVASPAIPSCNDLIIAATALHHGLDIVSRDVADYQKARAPVFNPWVDPLPSKDS